MTTVDSATFAKLHAASGPFEIKGLSLRIPDLSQLIALKLHAALNAHWTERDLGEVRELLTANSGVFSTVELQQICDQFGFF